MVMLAGEAPHGRLAWSAITTLLALNLLIHPSTLLLAGGAVGLYLLVGLWPRARDVATGRIPAVLAPVGPDLAYWRAWALAFLAAMAIALSIQYAEHVRIMLAAMPAGAMGSGSTYQISDRIGDLAQIWVGISASYSPLPVVLVVAGLGALVWRVTGRARLLVGAWLVSTVFFLGVDIATGLQVRYGYFSAPLACVAVVALFEPAFKWPLGRVVWWALLAFVAAAGLSLWAETIFSGITPTVNGLTH
jgi:hypothetical protein